MYLGALKPDYFLSHQCLQVAGCQGLALIFPEGCAPRQAPHNPALGPGF